MVIADTGFFVALANARDEHHAASVAALGRLGQHLVTTWPVVTETCYLLSARMGPHATSAFIEVSTRMGYEIATQTTSDLDRIRTLMVKYASLPMDLADASLVLLAETLGQGDILSTDVRDFGVYRFKNRKPFRNLLLR